MQQKKNVFWRTRQTLWGDGADANPKLLPNDTWRMVCLWPLSPVRGSIWSLSSVILLRHLSYVRQSSSGFHPRRIWWYRVRTWLHAECMKPLIMPFISQPSRQLADNCQVVNYLFVRVLRWKTRWSDSFCEILGFYWKSALWQLLLISINLIPPTGLLYIKDWKHEVFEGFALRLSRLALSLHKISCGSG